MKRFHLPTLLGVVSVLSFVLAASLRSPVCLAIAIVAFLCTPILVMALYLHTPIRPPRRRVGPLQFPRIRTWG